MVLPVRAAVMTGPGKIELRNLPQPELGEDDGLLRVEACGVSEADPVLLRRADLAPAILGHEIFGTISEIGAAAAKRWNVRRGARVLLQEYLPCHACKWCAVGEYRLCASAQPGAPDALRYGMTGTAIAPSLWGGFSEVLYLHPRCILHPVPDNVADENAILALPLSNAVQWAVLGPAPIAGKTVLVFGSGLTGLGAVCAAREAGAGKVILCGLKREVGRFDLARRLGADFTFEADSEGLEERIVEATMGEGAETIVDTTSDTSGRVAATAISVACTGATLVLGGIGMVPLNLGETRRKYLTIKPLRGHSAQAVRQALEILGKPNPALGELTGRSFPLVETGAAIRAGDPENAEFLHAVVRPWM